MSGDAIPCLSLHGEEGPAGDVGEDEAVEEPGEGDVHSQHDGAAGVGDGAAAREVHGKGQRQRARRAEPWVHHRQWRRCHCWDQPRSSGDVGRLGRGFFLGDT